LCNHAHAFSISTKSGGLQTGARAEGFSSHVDYSVTASWASSVNLQTSGVPGQTTPESITSGAFAGNLELDITVGSNGANGLPLLSGAYSDNLLVRFKPLI
jgi:hypothetical protein